VLLPDVNQTICSMYKLLKSNFFWLFYTISFTIFSFKIFVLWGTMVAVLFTIFWVFRLTHIESKLVSREHFLYLFVIFLYPPAEATVLWVRMQGLIPPDFNWINRLEHLCWAIALMFFFLPFIATIWKRLDGWQNLIFVFGFVCLLGNMNEFLEYTLRIQNTPIDQTLFAKFYTDTILDMTMNLLGGWVGFALLTQVFAKSNKTRVVGDGW
jgi:hypothetical protein